VALSAAGLPAAWYVTTLRSERIAVAGGTWPGAPGVMMKAAMGWRLIRTLQTAIW